VGRSFFYNFKQFAQPIISSDVYASSVESLAVEGSRMRKLLQRFLRDEDGATAIEYGLIAAGISVAIITVVQGLGSKLSNTFSNIDSKLN